MTLPLVLLWSFVACLSLCSDHRADAQDDTAQLRSISESHDDEDCPIPAASFLLPGRQSDVSAPQINEAFHVTCHMTGAAPRRIDQPPRSALLSNLPSTSDPPLKRLGALRI